MLGVAFLMAFVVQRSRSGFLAAEADVGHARELAREHGLRTSEVLALHELYGGRLSRGALRDKVARVVEERDALGHILLAVLAVRGKRALAERLRREAGADPGAIARAVRSCREAVEDAVRFASVAGRYAARGHDA